MTKSKLFIAIALAFSICLVALSFSAVAGPNARAVQYPDTVLELFTSQGCSSCPRANRFVCETVRREDGVLALSYSVDYWDYLGWTDTLGKPEFSQRQRIYAKALTSTPYTPQLILNGDMHKAKFSRKQVTARTLAAKPKLSLNLDGEGLQINIAASDLSAPAVINIVHYTPGEQDISVGAGENKGRTVTLVNVVTDWSHLKTLAPGQAYNGVVAPPAPGTAIAVLVQGGVGGPVLSAATYSP